MSQQITTNMPQVIPTGFKDESIQRLLPQPLDNPIHLPLFYIQAPTGDSENIVQIKDGDLTRLYGDAVVDPRGPYYNHATALLQVVLAAGNSAFVKRVVRPTSTTVNGVTTLSNLPKAANLTLFCTVDTTTAIHPFMRDASGVVILDTLGNPTYDTAATVTGGITLKYHWAGTGALTAAQLEQPQTTNGTTVLPLLTVQHPFVGVDGDKYGIRLFMAGPYALNPGDIDIVNDQQALIFNAQLIFRDTNSSPQVLQDLYSESTNQFCFKTGTYNYKTNQDLTIQSLVTKWTNDGKAAGTSPVYGPLGSVVVHSNNLNTLLTELLVAENASAPTPVASQWLLDFMTGIDMQGRAHYGFQIDKTGDMLVEGQTYYLTEGNDGDLTNATFETAVLDEINTNYQNPAYPLLDDARFPFSVVYDSGFSTPVKKALMKWTSYRKDVSVGVGTHVVGDATLTLSEEISVGIDLRASAMLYSESSLWGTPACRIVIMGQSGELINSVYTKRVSTLFDLVAKRSMYLGAGDGKAKSGLNYSESPLNIVTTMKNLSNTYMGVIARGQAWSAGINYAQSRDMNSDFFAGLQTVYGISNSVLTNELFMQICTDVQKQSAEVWRIMTNNMSLSDAQFLERSNKELAKLVDGKYDNLVQIVPNAYFTPADSARGYSWVLEVDVYGNVARTVETVNVITRRAMPVK